MEARTKSMFPSAGELNKYRNDDGSVTVCTIVPFIENPDALLNKIRQDMISYIWRNEDALLATYPKNGTHLMWEIMTMLQRGSAEYIKESKALLMFDSSPINDPVAQELSSPRVLNTHLRLDVLPKQFRGVKTVCVIRNPKDTVVSYYYHLCKANLAILPDSKELQERFGSLTFDDIFQPFIKPEETGEEWPFGDYFSYTEYMWSLRDDPNMLIVFFEDLKKDTVATIQRINEFMNTNCSAELVQEIAEATNINKMREAKAMSLGKLADGFKEMKVAADSARHVYRKGEIGDWKNHFTVAQNEQFDEVLKSWSGGRDIPFQYE